MKRSTRAIIDRSADPLRILFVEPANGDTEFTLERCDRACTIKRLASLPLAAHYLKTSLFQVLIVNDSQAKRVNWNELEALQQEFPAVDIVVLTDADKLDE